MARLISFFGLITMMLLAWAVSANRSRMNFRLIASGVALQLAIQWLFEIHDWLYAVTNLGCCFVLGYVFSVIIPAERKSTEGLTIYTVGAAAQIREPLREEE